MTELWYLYSDACFPVFINQTCNLQESYWAGLTRHLNHQSVSTDAVCAMPFSIIKSCISHYDIFFSWDYCQRDRHLAVTFMLLKYYHIYLLPVLWTFLCIPNHTENECQQSSKLPFLKMLYLENCSESLQYSLHEHADFQADDLSCFHSAWTLGTVEVESISPPGSRTSDFFSSSPLQNTECK